MVALGPLDSGAAVTALGIYGQHQQLHSKPYVFNAGNYKKILFSFTLSLSQIVYEISFAF